jgi:hypothetical protein
MNASGPALASWPREQGHDVFSVFNEARGMIDEGIIRKALAEHLDAVAARVLEVLNIKSEDIWARGNIKG